MKKREASLIQIKCSVVDWHLVGADPDPNFHVGANPDLKPDPDDDDLHADCGSYRKFHTCWKIIFFCLLLVSALQNMFYLSHQCQRCHNFKYFGQHIELLWKKVYFFNFFI